MTTPSRTLLVRFQPWQQVFEIGFWVVVLVLQVLFNATVIWLDLQRATHEHAYWQPLVWELTSNLAVGMLIPLIVAFERRFPLWSDTLPRNIWPHLAASLAFCLAHVLIMRALRQAIYAWMGQDYPSASWATTLLYEYLKDVRSYFLIIVAVLSYRLVLLRLQGEASVLDAPEPPVAPAAATAPPPPRPERFLVKKLRKEFLIAATDIEWLQAQGNYVGLHVNGHDYLLRSTLNDFLDQLDPRHFVRVHRSHAVNLSRIAEIEPLDGGDARLRMKDGSQVPCSRRYREALTTAGMA
ncbi:MAG: LytTR family DNA-binding domain-containing protein [Ramlibacter sp.]|nr:LytTR family DNA-binding domain-containing protein [Ramlibacter sp.]